MSMKANLPSLAALFSVFMASVSPANADSGEPAFTPFSVDPECVQMEMEEFAFEKWPQTATRQTAIEPDHVYFWKMEINMELHFSQATHGLAYPTVDRLVLEYDMDGSNENSWELNTELNYTTNSMGGKGTLPQSDLFELNQRIESCAIRPRLFS